MNIKKFFLSLFVTLLAIAVVFGGVMAGKLLSTGNLPDSLSALLDREEKNGRVNFLLMGLDDGGMRADTIMLASVDKKDKTVKILSVPRDTRVEVNGKHIKINATMGYKSREELMISKIKEITGLPVHYYAEVDFDGFKEIIDILGGVDIDVPYDMDYDDPAQNLHIHFKKGMQHLDGQAAHDYVRFRHNNNGSAPGDYALGDPGRIKAQQAFLKELLKQKLQPQYLMKAPKLVNAIYDHVRTNFTAKEALSYVKILKKMDTETVETHMLPGSSKMLGGASYYIYDEAKTKQLIQESFESREEE